VLYKRHLRNNGLQRLPAAAFRDLTHLEYLDLTGNELTCCDAITQEALATDLLQSALVDADKICAFHPECPSNAPSTRSPVRELFFDALICLYD